MRIYPAPAEATSPSTTAAKPSRIELPHSPRARIAGVLERPDPGAVEHALLLLPPAGPADVDLSLGSRGIYRELARLLSDEGVASLRISSRGIPPAEGDWIQTTFEDRVRDALATYDWMRRQPGFEDAHIGVAGISEGGAVALAVVARREEAAAVVVVSTPMRDGVTTMRGQRDRLLTNSQGSPLEYAQLPELIDRELWSEIARWLIAGAP